MPTMDRAGRSSSSDLANPTATPRKKRNGDAGARSKLIEATARIMREEGYAAATSRRVAAEAGVRQPLVYYYFPTMDDLFVEVLRAGAEVALERMRTLLTDDDPLQALWLLSSDSAVTSLNTEFMALANHRKAIGAKRDLAVPRRAARQAPGAHHRPGDQARPARERAGRQARARRRGLCR